MISARAAVFSSFSSRYGTAVAAHDICRLLLLLLLQLLQNTLAAMAMRTFSLLLPTARLAQAQMFTFANLMSLLYGCTRGAAAFRPPAHLMTGRRRAGLIVKPKGAWGGALPCPGATMASGGWRRAAGCGPCMGCSGIPWHPLPHVPCPLVNLPILLLPLRSANKWATLARPTTAAVRKPEVP